jgi:probable DNA metabolism protein
VSTSAAVMETVCLADETDFEGWRQAVRRLVAAGIPWQEVRWTVGAGVPGLFDGGTGGETGPQGSGAFTVPRPFLPLARSAFCHRDPERFALLHGLVERLQVETGLLAVAVDPLVARVEAMAKAVRRDIHKMHAFVRFREVTTQEGPHFVAWFEPDHHIVEAAAPFFVRRFAAMRWSILTPERCAHWDGSGLVFTEGVGRDRAPGADEVEDLWRGYYASIFNPARLKVEAMASEMPRKYWRNLPEAPLIPSLIATARERTETMVAADPTLPRRRRPSVPRPPAAPRDDAQARSADDTDLEAVRREASECRACPLWADATQTVFGEGSPDADVMFVGEQPGDKEDLAGRPFVGPAGQLFDKALGEAGIDRKAAYVTNAVKHFKFEPRGKIRLHMKPNTSEITACRWWIDREMALLKPRLVVAMGATAVQSVFGKAMPIKANRGRLMELPSGTPAFVTVHPSYLLRLPDPAAKEEEFRAFVDDLRAIAAWRKSRASG